jgi:uncharacterized membrane protein YfcA
MLLDILALVLAIGIGFSLALLGSGGSIITLPVLVYAARVPPQHAVGMSLAVVGGTTLAASLLNVRAGLVHIKAAALFSVAGMVGAFGGAQLTHLVAPAILLLLFAALMIAVAMLMFRRRADSSAHRPAECHWSQCAMTGLGVGGITGFLGVGGGFIIVPALVHFGGLPLKKAMATSLVVITVVSAAGLIGQLQHTTLDWRTPALFLLFALVGMFVGRAFAARAHPEHLRRWFAWFVLVVALFVIGENWKTLVQFFAAPLPTAHLQ